MEVQKGKGAKMAKSQAFLMAGANEKSPKQQHKKVENAESCESVYVFT